MKNYFNAMNLFLVSMILILGIGCSTGRHLTKIRKPDVAYENTLDEFSQFHRVDVVEMETYLNSAKKKAENSDFIGNIDENIFLLVDNKIAFTVTIHDKLINIYRGRNTNVNPTLFIPFSASIIKYLDSALVDYKLNRAEIFNASYILLIPCLNRMYSMPYLYDTKLFH